MHRSVNSYIGALLITIIGAGATLLIMHVADAGTLTSGPTGAAALQAALQQ